MYDPKQHTIIESCDWVESLKTITGDDRLGLYRHKIHNSFVLIRWMRRIGEEGGLPCFHEYFCFRAHPDTLRVARSSERAGGLFLPTPAMVKEMVLGSRKALEAIIAQQAEEERLRAEKEREGQRLKEDQMRHIQRKVGVHRADHPAVTGIATGDTPWEPFASEPGGSKIIEQGGV